MAYSTQILRLARQRLAQQKADRESQYQQNLHSAYAQEPRLREIDNLLRRSMAVAAQAVFTQGTDAAQAMAQARQANLSLQQERAAIVSRFAPGYLDETPVCPHCGGNGYVGAQMCSCLKELCRQEQMAQLSQLTTGQERFDTFRLDYYPEQIDSRYGASPRAIMEKNFLKCLRYAEGFDENSGNLLFVGGTGLGKTFLSACIANVVAEKGFSIAYESAPQLFAKLEKNRFSPDTQSRADAERFLSCDLLIIDDLGTEMPGNFVTAALYDLVNQRLISGKSMIISTNLNVRELSERYSPQIGSRLGGSFKGMTFVGEDIRVQKNRGV